MAVITFAHRGARLEEPENTIPAFRRALGAGVTGLETDVWRAGDGTVVCAHDPVLRSGLRRVRIAHSSAAKLATVGVPALADVYGELGTEYELSVDLKEETEEAAAALIAVATEYGALERLWLCAPELELLVNIRARHPTVKLVHSTYKGLIPTTLERHASDLANAHIDVLNLHRTEWTAGLVSLVHRFDVLAFGWDAQEARHLRALLAMGIDAVYCDHPDRMVATVAEFRADPAD
ncbi:MAG TPA: glycerophosphodiester phosphodiesterase [Acidimicrobiia bacterium]|nr:glycerophosphodiester phosphodiesterase [Acidimicrobiia bacterium]